MAPTPLVLDLDGTLLDGDTLVVGLQRLLRHAPLRLPAGLLLLVRGRPAFKGWLARFIVPRIAEWPWDHEVVAWAAAEHAAGRRLELATGSHARVAAAVARHFGWFSAAYGSRDRRNCTGSTKLAVLTARHGAQGFAYAGNERKDAKVWRGAAAAVVVGGDGLAALARSVGPVEHHFPRQRPRGWPWTQACARRRRTRPSTAS